MSQQHPRIKLRTQLQAQHTQWYYTDINKKTCGPIDISELYQLFQTNIITKDTFVWNPKIVRIWAPLQKIVKLYSLLKTENLNADSLNKYLDDNLSDMALMYSSMRSMRSLIAAEDHHEEKQNHNISSKNNNNNNNINNNNHHLSNNAIVANKIYHSANSIHYTSSNKSNKSNKKNNARRTSHIHSKTVTTNNNNKNKNDYIQKYGHKPQEIMSENDGDYLYENGPKRRHKTTIDSVKTEPCKKHTNGYDEYNEYIEEKDYDQPTLQKTLSLSPPVSNTINNVNNLNNSNINKSAINRKKRKSQKRSTMIQSGNIQIITEEENKAINSLHKRYMKTSKIIQAYQCGVEMIDNQTSQCKEDIFNTFDELINKLQKRKQCLLYNVEQIKNEKKQILMKQIDEFKYHKQEILNAKKEYDHNMKQIANHNATSTDIERRKLKNLKLCMNVLSNKTFSTKANMEMDIIPFIHVIFDKNKHDQFINNLGFIDGNHKPLIPKLSIKNIDSDYSTIKWEMDNNINIESKKPKNKHANKGMYEYVPYKKYVIKEFEIQIAQIRGIKNNDNKQLSAIQDDTEEIVMNNILSNLSNVKKQKHDQSQNSEDLRRVTVHGYEDYSDEEKEYSTTQQTQTMNGEETPGIIQFNHDNHDNHDNDNHDEKEKEKSQENECKIDEFKTVGIILNDDKKERVNVWSYTIRNLCAESEYFVRIRCKNELGGYGEFCKEISFKTLNRKQSEELEWCLEPYSLNKDKEHLNMNGLRIYENGENNRIQIYRKQFCKLIVNYNILSWRYNKFIWCFQLHLISNCSWLGFIENPINKTVTSWNNWLGNELYDYSIGINNINTKCFPYSKSKSIGTIKLLQIPKQNDKIYFIIDLTQKNCQIYHNNYNLGIIFKDIPIDIVPAISNGEDPMDCTVTFRTSL